MPRPWLERVVDYEPYRAGIAYLCAVILVQRLTGPDQIKVDLEHLDDIQLGRPFTVLFPRPIPPAGRPIEFFRACGLDVAIDGKFAPKEAIGRHVLVRFDRAADGQWYPVRFESVAKESKHDATA